MHKKEKRNHCKVSWSHYNRVKACMLRQLSRHRLQEDFRQSAIRKIQRCFLEVFFLCTLVSIHISLFRLRVREWKNGRNERINNPNENFIDICDVHRNKNGKTLVVGDEDVFSGFFTNSGNSWNFYNTIPVESCTSHPNTPQSGKIVCDYSIFIRVLLVRSYFPETPSHAEGKREIMMEK